MFPTRRYHVTLLFPTPSLRSMANAVNLDAGEVLLSSGHLVDSMPTTSGNKNEVPIFPARKSPVRRARLWYRRLAFMYCDHREKLSIAISPPTAAQPGSRLGG